MGERTTAEAINKAAAQLEYDVGLWDILYKTGCVNVAPRWPLTAQDYAGPSAQPVYAEAPIVTFWLEVGDSVAASFGGVTHNIIQNGKWVPMEEGMPHAPGNHGPKTENDQ